MSTPFISQKRKPTEELLKMMKLALSNMKVRNPVIGSPNGKDLIENNKTDNYDNTLFTRFLENKISNDYDVIRDGLDLLTFYLEHNPEIHQFDWDINKIQTLINKRNTL